MYYLCPMKALEIRNIKPLLYALAFAVMVYIGVQILIQWQTFTHIYYPAFYEKFFPFWSGMFGLIPLSIGDIFYGIILISLLISLYVVIRCFVLKQYWRGFRILGRWVYIFTFFYILFQFAWGFNYYRPNLYEKFQAEPPSVEQLKTVASKLQADLVPVREGLEEDQTGVLYMARDEMRSHFQRRLLQADYRYRYIPKVAIKKYSLYSFFMRHFGVTGYYNPFSGEAQITRGAPRSILLFSLAHEQAHQMGYAYEYEANFVGYVSLVESTDPTLRYIGQWRALQYVLREIYPQDSIFVQEVVNQYTPGMQRDRAAEKAFAQKYSGAANDAFGFMNQQYLKRNNQPEGLRSYNRFVDLLIHREQ
ncbi:MAG: DUF3810 domain-containing protein [Weeksellaceae bacterium]|nr:DUF3810 domain-containing protein [Weeksellaceae bacterium]